MITYKEFGPEEMERVKAIYASEGWSSYLQDDEALERAFRNSLCCLGAWQEDRLIGFVRCVGDGEHILLVQDLIVMPEFRHQGIGKALFRSVWDRYGHVRMFQVNTDAEDETDNRFYRSFGMRPIAEGGMISYFR